MAADSVAYLHHWLPCIDLINQKNKSLDAKETQLHILSHKQVMKYLKRANPITTLTVNTKSQVWFIANYWIPMSQW
jgi:hypothetical protein